MRPCIFLAARLDPTMGVLRSATTLRCGGRCGVIRCGTPTLWRPRRSTATGLSLCLPSSCFHTHTPWRAVTRFSPFSRSLALPPTFSLAALLSHTCAYSYRTRRHTTSLPSSFTRRTHCWRPAARLSRSPLLRSRARRVCHGGSLPSVAGIYIHLPSRGGAHSFTSTNHLSLSFTALTVPSHVPPTTLLSPSLFIQRTLPAGLHRRGLWDGGLQHRGAAA